VAFLHCFPSQCHCGLSDKYSLALSRGSVSTAHRVPLSLCFYLNLLFANRKLHRYITKAAKLWSLLTIEDNRCYPLRNSVAAEKPELINSQRNSSSKLDDGWTSMCTYCGVCFKKWLWLDTTIMYELMRTLFVTVDGAARDARWLIAAYINSSQKFASSLQIKHSLVKFTLCCTVDVHLDIRVQRTQMGSIVVWRVCSSLMHYDLSTAWQF